MTTPEPMPDRLQRAYMLMAETIETKYADLFPGYPRPEPEDLVTWLAAIGMNGPTFAFGTIPDPSPAERHAQAVRIVSVGPVGGWRTRDAQTGEMRTATSEEVDTVVQQMRAEAPQPAPPPAPARRRKRPD